VTETVEVEQPRMRIGSSKGLWCRAQSIWEKNWGGKSFNLHALTGGGAILAIED
jgi:hypothetical protein